MLEFSTKGKTLILVGFSSFWIIYNAIRLSYYTEQLAFYLCISQLSIVGLSILYQYVVLPRLKKNKRTLFVPNSILLLVTVVIMIVYILICPKKSYIDDKTDEIFMWLAYGLYLFGHTAVLYINYKNYTRDNTYIISLV
jgi:hypothetical protein